MDGKNGAGDGRSVLHRLDSRGSVDRARRKKYASWTTSTSGHLGNIAGHIASGNIEFIRADLRDPGIRARRDAGRSHGDSILPPTMADAGMWTCIRRAQPRISFSTA